MNKLSLFILLAFITVTASAQNEADTIQTLTASAQNEADTIQTLSASAQKKADTIHIAAQDVIIKTNGNLFQCKIIEVNDSLVMYKSSATDTTRQFKNIPRGEVYAISYGNGITMPITPELMGKEASIYPEDNCEAWDTFKNNLGRGSINIGVGFINQYSPLKNAKSFEDNQVMPSVFAGYTFRISKAFKAGAHIEIGGNKLTKSGESEYDQLRVSAEIDENFYCVGLFCRYDILKGIFKPYVKGGVNFIGLSMVTTSEATSLDGSSFSLKTVVHQNGIKPGLILRGGLDVYFSKLFGIYGDVGTGISLVQVGVLFNLE